MYYIVVREAREGTADTVNARNVLHSAIMSHCGAAFSLFLFQELTLQLTVLLAAILFIFVGLPILWCIITLPIVAALVYMFTYATHLFKATEVTQHKCRKQWVAEAYEPYFLSEKPQSLRYVVMDEAEAEGRIVGAEGMKRQIVGTVCVRDFHGPEESVWLYGMAVDPRYRRKGVGRALGSAVLQWARERELDSVQLATTDLQNEARLMFQKLGMQMHQMYHKELIGAALTLTMFHQIYDLTAERTDGARKRSATWR